jgi:NAD(P)-dependent dehydrogenase (short-subunit alcohol dehydrogenase family)
VELSSVVSVWEAASTLAQLTPSIDILFNNAGVMVTPERILPPEWGEMHLATNILGHLLLTSLLLSRLKAAGNGSRVVNITSAGFMLTPFRFSDYNFESLSAA